MINKILPLLLVGLGPVAFAQYAPPDPSGFEGLIVETYYVADVSDAADAEGGPGLTQGTKVYRVYADMIPGYKLLTVGGFPGHPLTLNTTTSFFNNDDRGEAWGRNIPAQNLDDNTVAIDSWLTFGAASTQHWGVLKNDDTDGSIVGGANNNSGLLANDDPQAGIPLTTADGLLNLGTPPGQIAFVGDPPDCFDSGGGTSYSNDNFAYAILGGVVGPTPSNRVLIGQFATDGEFSFCINLTVRIPDSLVCDDPNCHFFLEFLSNLQPSDTVGGGFPVQNKFLDATLCWTSSSQVVDCQGITNGPALPGTTCDDGNTDTSNDQYNPGCACVGEDCEGVLAGPALPGTPCDDNDPSTIDDQWVTGCSCAGMPVGIAERYVDQRLSVVPNPTTDLVFIALEDVEGGDVQLILRDLLGKALITTDAGAANGDWYHTMDLSPFGQGVYLLEVQTRKGMAVRRIQKQ